MAELKRGIASVGFGPPLSCSPFGSSWGSVVVTTPGQVPKGCAPEPLLMIRLPAPDRITLPVKKHSFAPLLAMIVLSSVKDAAKNSSAQCSSPTAINIVGIAPETSAFALGFSAATTKPTAATRARGGVQDTASARAKTATTAAGCSSPTAACIA